MTQTWLERWRSTVSAMFFSYESVQSPRDTMWVCTTFSSIIKETLLWFVRDGIGFPLFGAKQKSATFWDGCCQARPCSIFTYVLCSEIPVDVLQVMNASYRTLQDRTLQTRIKVLHCLDRFPSQASSSHFGTLSKIIVCPPQRASPHMSFWGSAQPEPELVKSVTMI